MTRTSDLIVCATDFSEESARALRWAVGFAGREGARIDLVHVVPAPTRDREQLATDAATFEAARLDDARQRLAKEAAGAVQAAGVTVQPQVLTGDPHAQIVEHARQSGARAIVLGAAGRPRVERWILGSIAERTVRAASCPVVVVPRDADEHAWAPSEPGKTARPLKALVGLEGNEGPALLNFVADLRRRDRCDVTFLHLYWPLEEYRRLGLRGPRNPLETDPDVVKDVEPKLRAIVGGLPGQGNVTLQIRPAWGAPGANLMVAVAEDQPCDLLVVGSHQRHGLARVLKGSVSTSLARQRAGVPIVCVPGAFDAAAARTVPHILTVLAPTDLSELANAAIPHAYGLLRATGGVVELVHVHERGLPSPGYVYDIPDELSAAERTGIENQLRALVPPEAESLGITTHVSVIDGGRAAETIVAAAERLHVDAISLGSHGRGAVARAVLGSVAEAVVRSARRPVLVVPARR